MTFVFSFYYQSSQPETSCVVVQPVAQRTVQQTATDTMTYKKQLDSNLFDLGPGIDERGPNFEPSDLGRIDADRIDPTAKSS